MKQFISFEDAVRLLRGWGFLVQAGPGPGEVTLIMQGPDFQTSTVHKAEMLPEITAVLLQIHVVSETLETTSSIAMPTDAPPETPFLYTTVVAHD